MSETRYWIQRQAPKGNWIDRVGMPLDASEEQARQMLKEIAEKAPRELKLRLVLRVTTDTEVI